MESSILRKKFLEFFEKKGHQIVPSSSLIPSDPSVLYTTAGMQQFKPYFLGENSPYGNKATSCQKCLRTSDIEEVGDDTHLTFFEMLGNFSFGAYFKEETIKLALEFLKKICFLPEEKLWFTYFKGDEEISSDQESKKILLNQEISLKKIIGSERQNNFWGPTGESGPCGPTVEIHYENKEIPCKKGSECFPNCECGRFTEIWNLVFNEFFQDNQGNLVPLKQKGVDTGLGMERLLVILQNKKSVFGTDLFLPAIKEIKSQNAKERSIRIIADHLKAAVFMASEGIVSEKTGKGYILRRVLRKAIREKELISAERESLINVSKKIIEIYKDIYPEIEKNKQDILNIVKREEEAFKKTLGLGLKKMEKLLQEKKERVIRSEEAFYLFETYGFPLELIQEMAEEKGFDVDKQGFYREFEKHQEISRAGVQKKFGGGGIEQIKDKTMKEQAIKLHTATHLLHAALRQVLGEEVKQMGSDIAPERLRFDFSFGKKLDSKEIQKIQDTVNEIIAKGIDIERNEMDLKKAINEGALSFFKEKYPDRVTVYSVKGFSKEICAGPHVRNTKELGGFFILKEESVGAGVRRIKAVLR